jgi:hypothetical protein
VDEEATNNEQNHRHNKEAQLLTVCKDEFKRAHTVFSQLQVQFEWAVLVSITGTPYARNQSPNSAKEKLRFNANDRRGVKGTGTE